MKIEGGRVKILKKCTEFVIRVIKLTIYLLYRMINHLTYVLNQTSRHEILHLQLSRTTIFLSNPELKYLFRPKDGE